MTQEKVKQVYEELAALHEAYFKSPDLKNISALANDAKAANARVGDKFCNKMTRIFYDWYVWRPEEQPDDYKGFYGNLGWFHAKALEKAEDTEAFWQWALRVQLKLHEKYNFRACEVFLTAISDQIEAETKAMEGGDAV